MTTGMTPAEHPFPVASARVFPQMTFNVAEYARQLTGSFLMEGGRIVQIGTAREIIANPVSDYVADFVAHMNPLGVLTATDLAVPGRADDAVPHVPDSTPVREVMELLTRYPEVALTNGTKITRESVISKLIDPRG